MKQSKRLTWLGYAISAGLALACGGEPGFDEDAPAPDPGDAEVQFDREELVRAGVTSEEMLVLEDYFAGSGAPTSIEGRLLRWDDAMLMVDDVLTFAEVVGQSTLIEKGYAQRRGTISEQSGSNINFFRPDIGLRIFVIVEDGVSNSVFNAVAAVFSEWVGLATDCLGVSIYEVVRRSTYNAKLQSDKDTSYEVTFSYIPKTDPLWDCQVGQGACGFFPLNQSIKVGSQFVSRLAVGDRIRVDTASFPTNTTAEITQFKNAVRHEIGHTLGFGHQARVSDANIAFVIPLTTSCGINCETPYASVMRTPASLGVFSNDDIDAMRTLYANVSTRDNDDCQYVNGMRLLAGLP